MRTIFKTKLDVCDYQAVELPQDYKIIHVDMQQGSPCIWYECTPDMPLMKVEILCFGTGYRMPDPGTLYIENKNRRYRPFSGNLSVGNKGVSVAVEYFDSDIVRFDPKDKRPEGGGEYWKSRGA